MTQTVALREPRDVAWFLASYARDALGRVDAKGSLPALNAIREALEEALGVHFEGERGDHFFRSTLVQTLFYGIFAAWVLYCRQTPSPGPKDRFDWKSAIWHLRVPMLQALFQQVSDPSKLKALDLVELLDWTGGALNRVDRTEFFARFKDAEAVQFFYEPFLEAFDPDLRKELGVWYTPTEVVTYMVARVDKALKEDLGITEGLAADNVFVLDPCTGTGSFLGAVLRRIAESLEARGLGGLKGSVVRTAATTRVFGFEIMPAPYVIAHLQIGLVLQDLGAPLADDGSQRAGVFLTNALTGWEPTTKEKQHVAFPEMEAERDKANEVKRDRPILVILGNPPYNGYAGLAVEEERDLTASYRTVRRVRRPEGQGLNDLYVRFFRMAERRIAEKTGRGIVCFISNYSWLDGLSFTGMRERYLDAFDLIRVDCLNGDKYRTGKVAPDGTPDPSIFSTPHNREGIQVGTAIATLIRKGPTQGTATVAFRHLWGRDKHTQLTETAEAEPGSLYQTVTPCLPLGLPFMETAVADGFFDWPALPELLPISFPGVKTSRDEFLVDTDLDRLRERVTLYFDPTIPDSTIAQRFPSVMHQQGSFNGPAIRQRALDVGLREEGFTRYAYRPFDIRWLYWDGESGLLDRAREEYKPHVFKGNQFIEAREKQSKEDFSRGTITSVLSDNFGSGLSTFFPAFIREESDHGTGDPERPVPNLAASVAKRLTDQDQRDRTLFNHIVATLHSPRYREDNAGALRMDWPHIPLPDDPDLLRASATLGETLAALLDPERSVEGVTTGTLHPHLRVLGVPTRVDGGQWTATDFELRAGWGSTQRTKTSEIVMPGRGLTQERDYTPEEAEALAAAPVTSGDPLALLGHRTLDVHLNPDAFWSNVPERVWGYKLGGYQVIKKWLSYRELPILERPLKPEEVFEVSTMIRRIAAILLLSPALDANYTATRDAPSSWMRAD